MIDGSLYIPVAQKKDIRFPDVYKRQSDRTMSGTGYDIFRDYRLEIGERLKQAPMGYFSEQNLGTIQTILTTTIADLEGYSMMAIEQMTRDVDKRQDLYRLLYYGPHYGR